MYGSDRYGSGGGGGDRYGGGGGGDRYLLKGRVVVYFIIYK